MKALFAIKSKIIIKVILCTLQLLIKTFLLYTSIHFTLMDPCINSLFELHLTSVIFGVIFLFALLTHTVRILCNYRDGVVMSQQWMGTLGKWAQLCTWVEGHEGSSMNHLSRVSLPQIPMIYPRQERPAMRGGQMHTVCSQYTFTVFTCTCLCSKHTQTQSHVQTYIHRNTHIVYTPKVISSTAAFVCLQPRQTANKRPISKAIHL